MTSPQKLTLLAGLAILTLLGIFLVPPIPQPPAFHHFADTRAVWGIPNFTNVISNVPFVLVGLAGLVMVLRADVTRAIRFSYIVLFIGVLLTGLGSAYYHWAPDNDRLVWDRLPMTIVFMSFLSATLSELVSPKIGYPFLFPLLVIGVFSVYWWHYTELLERGDLRLYYWVQFFPMLAIILLLMLYYTPAMKPVLRAMAWIVVWYAIAKILEQLDYPILRVLGVGGHALKHLAAAASTGYFILLFRLRYISYRTTAESVTAE